MELLVGTFGIFVGGVDVAGGGVERFVAEENLDGGRVGAFFGQICGIAVTQGVSAGQYVYL